MPNLITIGAASAKGFGFGAASKGNYWVLKVNSGGNFYNIDLDSSGNINWTAQQSQDFGYGKFSTLGANQLYAKAGTSFYAPDIRSVGSDSSGNVYVSGSHNNGGGSLFPAVAKFNSSGSIQWGYYFNNVQSDVYPYNVFHANDSSGNSIVVGGEYLYGFFIKVNSSGASQFAKRYGNYSARFMDVKIQGSNYYLFGYSAGGADGNILTVKTDTSGAIVWQTSLTLSPDVSYPRGLGGCVDSSGNTFAFGRWQNPTNTAYHELFYYKCNSSGTVQWKKKINTLYSGNNGYNQARVYCDADADGKVYFATTFNYGGVSGASSYKCKITCIDTNGAVLWSNDLYITGNQYTYAEGLKVDANGNLFVVISYGSTYLVKLPSNGSLTGTYGDITYAESYASGSDASSFTTGTTSSMSDYSYNPVTITNLTNKTPSISTTLTNI